MRTRVIPVVSVALLAAVTARVAASSRATRLRPLHSLDCGVEQWRIKTLEDRPRLMPVRKTTIAHLVSIPRPAHVPSTKRLASERRICSVTASARLIREESDQDLHIELQSGSKHLLAEAPNAPFCTSGATAYRKRQMRTARTHVVRMCARAHVVGVAFFDFNHGQTGVAPNVIELHPILGYSCLSAGG